MQWRSPNRRRSLARVTSDLGPVIGDEPMRVPKRPPVPRERRWIERGNAAVTGWFAVAVYVAVVGAGIWLAFQFATMKAPMPRMGL